MTYQEYINLGFVREDYEDNVVYNETGHHPFVLRKDLTSKVYVFVDYEELDKPRLVVRLDEYGDIDYQFIETNIIKNLW